MAGVAHFAAEVDDRIAGHDHALQRGIFGKLADGVGRDTVAPRSVAWLVGQPSECLGSDGDDDVGVRAAAVDLLGVVELGERDGAIGEALRIGACIAVGELASSVIERVQQFAHVQHRQGDGCCRGAVGGDCGGDGTLGEATGFGFFFGFAGELVAPVIDCGFGLWWRGAFGGGNKIADVVGGGCWWRVGNDVGQCFGGVGGELAAGNGVAEIGRLT